MLWVISIKIERAMKIMSLNTWKCEHHYIDRLVLMGRELAKHQPDVLLLQEVFKAGDRFDTARFLADLLDMHISYQPAREKHRTVDNHELMSESGLAILSQTPLTETGLITLPTVVEDGERLAQWAIIEHEHHKIAVLNTHLTHLKDQDKLRSTQIEAILSFATTELVADVYLMGGDMNAELHNPSLYLLAQSRWYSHWPAQLGLNTMNIGEQQSIDHLFLAATSKAKWVNGGACLDQSLENGLFPSDHKAVLGQLCLK